MPLATVSRQQTPTLELAAELGHIRDLVFVRDLLRERGAPAAELHECDAVVAAARARLATSAKESSAPHAAAA